MKAPDGIDRGDAVETPVGTMYLRHVGWGVLIDNSSNTTPHVEGRPYLTVAGKEFTATIGVYPNGEIERQYIHKRGSHDDAAPSYQAKIVHAARVAAHEYIVNNPIKVAKGEHYRALMDYETAKATMARLKPEWDAAKKRRLEAVEALEEARVRLLEVEATTATKA